MKEIIMRPHTSANADGLTFTDAQSAPPCPKYSIPGAELANASDAGLPRMRTIKAAYAELVEADPGTSISMYFFRRAVLSDAIPPIRAGCRYLVNMADVYAFFENRNAGAVDQVVTGIRPVGN